MADTTLPGLLSTGDHASRPAASALGTGALYSCTDHLKVYQTDGSSWSDWAVLGGDVSAHLSDTSDAHDASAVSVADAGGYFTGTDAEAALQELGALKPAVPSAVQYATGSASSTSASATISAAAVGNRLIVPIVSRGRDVNTPTCTNVTFTEVGTAAFSTTVYISVYVGIVAGSPSGTSVAATATGTDWIAIDVWEVTDALTPTGGTSANLTNTDASAVVYSLIGPISPTKGQLVVICCGLGDGTTQMALDAAWPIRKQKGRGGVAISAIGYAPGGPISAWITSGTSGGDFAGLIVPVT